MAYVDAPVVDGGISTSTSTEVTETLNTTDTSYVPNSNHWESGKTATKSLTGSSVSALGVTTKSINTTAFVTDENVTYEESEDYEFTEEELKRLTMPTIMQQDKDILVAKHRTAWQNTNKRKEMLNEDRTQIQNNYGFPYYSVSSSGLNAAKYDYQIIPGDTRYSSGNIKTLESKLASARASLGIQVHGNNDIARAVKYYMYNRFKVPDSNMAYNRTFTHVFFTRPDLNILRCGGGNVYGPATQVKNHSDTALLYRMNPYLFKLLTDRIRCGDSNNFNMLLSNQVESFTIEDENLNAMEVGKSWVGNTMYYGDQYTGRSAGEFRCSFRELQDLSIIKLMKLWCTYIDNVSRGAWSPSYDLHGSAMLSKYGNYGASVSTDPVCTDVNASYVYSKTMDYAASAYVFTCGPDGESILYWSKYYGIFPANTGASMLSWDVNTPAGQENSKLDITFKYCYKKDLSPISLIEFNELGGFSSTSTSETYGTYTTNVKTGSEASFNPNYNHSSRPFVGCPFIEFDANAGDPTGSLGRNADMFGNRASYNIRLKFMRDADSKLSDELLYRSSLTNRAG